MNGDSLSDAITQIKMSDVEIYALAGKMGSGKDYIGKALNAMLPQKPTMFIALADQLKIDVIVKDNLDRSKVFGDKDEHTRLMLQKRGTEEGRDVYGEGIWIKYLSESILLHMSRGVKRFIVTDLRFKNEMSFFKNVDAVIFKVLAPSRNKNAICAQLARQGILPGDEGFQERYDKIADHRSEKDLDDAGDYFNYCIRNDPGERGILTLRNIVIDDIYEKLKSDNVFFVDLDDTLCECHKYYEDITRQVAAVIKVTKEDMARSYQELNKDWESQPFSREDFAERLVDTASLYTSDKTLLDKVVYELGMSVHDEKFLPFLYVFNALDKLRRWGKVVIFTLGHRADQMKKIYESGLSAFADEVEVSPIKDESMFKNLMQKYPADYYYMFGDSLRRDILPAKKCGITSYIVSENRSFPAIVDEFISSKEKTIVLSSSCKW